MPDPVDTQHERSAGARVPPRLLRALVLGAIGVAIAVGAVALGTRDSAVPGEQMAAPFSLASVTDASETVSLGLRDGRPAVVNFFASWCAPCERELPHFASASRRLEGQVSFIGIAHQDDAELAAAMLRRFDVTFPAGNDPEGDVARRYFLRGMPSTAFVAADGTLVGVAAGELDARELDGWIQRTVAA